MTEFKSALDAAFGTGTVEAAQLNVDQLDGAPVAGHRREPVLWSVCRAEPVIVTYCLAERPEPVAAIAG